MRAVNLIPAEQRGGAPVGAGRSGGVAYAVLGLVVGLAVMALLYGMARHDVSTRGAEVAAISAQAQQAESAASRLAAYVNFVTLAEQRTAQAAQIVDSRFDWAHVLHEFGRVLPRTVSLSTLSGTVGASSTSSGPVTTVAAASSSGATPPGATPTFNIAGCATSQVQVARTLQRLRMIDGVREVTLQSSAQATNSGGAGGTGSSGGAVGCPASAPVFSATVTFEPLPTPPAAPASTTIVAGVATVPVVHHQAARR